jgi:hypothetical protein
VKSTIRDAVTRSAPNPDRPRLSTALERRFAPGEAQAAACYADAEATCDLALKIAAELEKDSGVVSGEIEMTESLAHRVEAVAVVTRTEEP